MSGRGGWCRLSRTRRGSCSPRGAAQMTSRQRLLFTALTYTLPPCASSSVRQASRSRGGDGVSTTSPQHAPPYPMHNRGALSCIRGEEKPLSYPQLSLTLPSPSDPDAHTPFPVHADGEPHARVRPPPPRSPGLCFKRAVHAFKRGAAPLFKRALRSPGVGGFSPGAATVTRRLGHPAADRPLRQHATLKGVVAGALAFSALGGTVPTSGALASQPALWLGARAFVALALGLVARAVDWKLLLVCALSAHALGSLFGSGESNLLERAFDITRWPGGSVPGLRDKVL
ncbi:hypothetical protein T492DRAFT_836819 [Pavlovales sp. CCMP2436]|nr:hypothetical protein T492DRAFT_836819 [Pavlovales sp. CCMP2436]